ncbi:MAG: class I mannose-6-phosphate isomerase [Lactobacillus sp.]|nr:class I mannose-6-phosphate isomerase [Lactobacillus sp.]
MAPIFLKPYLQTKIWGGKRLAEFNYDLPNDKVGEAWVISGYRKQASVVDGGEFDGQSLRDVYQNNPALFGNPTEKEFPLLVKFLDAQDNLSIQVHPDDEYAERVEHDRGKTESWYVLDCPDDAEIIFGHHAKNKAELKKMIEDHDWQDLLGREKVKKGDFFYVPSGTIHALTKGVMVIETQQSSDVTYRLYDYDRRDSDGNLRELHTQKAIDVIKTPYVKDQVEPVKKEIPGGVLTTLIEAPQSPHFNLWQLDIDSEMDFPLTGYPYYLVSVIDGAGKMDQYDLHKGSNFILPYGYPNPKFIGKLRLVISTPGE